MTRVHCLYIQNPPDHPDSPMRARSRLVSESDMKQMMQEAEEIFEADALPTFARSYILPRKMKQESVNARLLKGLFHNDLGHMYGRGLIIS